MHPGLCTIVLCSVFIFHWYLTSTSPLLSESIISFSFVRCGLTQDGREGKKRREEADEISSPPRTPEIYRPKTTRSTNSSSDESCLHIVEATSHYSTPDDVKDELPRPDTTSSFPLSVCSSALSPMSFDGWKPQEIQQIRREMITNPRNSPRPNQVELDPDTLVAYRILLSCIQQ